MRILALQPFDGGSHRRFLEGWQKHSEHQWTILGLPPIHWKWRMRHAPWTLAQKSNRLIENGQQFDAIFCTDMLPLHEWRGLVGPPLARLPAVIYFHENQLTYPTSPAASLDLHYGFTNLVAAANADAVWFNSAFHREEFLAAARQLLRRMPDHRSPGLLERVVQRSSVQYPGIDLVPPTSRDGRRGEQPFCIGWIARWEYDKGVDAFATTIDRLAAAGAEFQLVLLGQRYQQIPDSMQRLTTQHQHRIRHAGYVESRDEYWARVCDMDVVVSTASHEFFGIAMLEAASAGAVPVLPRRLAYPEIFAGPEQGGGAIFYDGTTDDLCNVLQHFTETSVATSARKRATTHAGSFAWSNVATRLDKSIQQLAENTHHLT